MPAPFSRLVHPTDLGSDSAVAFAHALRLALQFGGRLDVLHAEGHAAEDAWGHFAPVRGTLARWGLLPADAPPEAVADLGIQVRKLRVADDPVSAIARTGGAHDLIVLATHARTGLARLRRPSVAEAGVRAAGIAALFLPPGAAGFVDPATGAVQLERVLLPVGADPDGIAVAAALVHALGAAAGTFRVIHVGEDGLSGPFPTVAGWEWQAEAYAGAVVDTVVGVARAWPADLVVMPTHGHDSLVDDLFGSTVEQVVRAVACPVLVLPVDARG